LLNQEMPSRGERNGALRDPYILQTRIARKSA
jgi:hypothetical protein